MLTCEGTFALSPCFQSHTYFHLACFCARAAFHALVNSWCGWLSYCNPSIEQPCTVRKLTMFLFSQCASYSSYSLKTPQKRITAYLGSAWQLRRSTCSSGWQQCDARSKDHSWYFKRRSFDESVTGGSHTLCRCLTDLCITHHCGVFMTTPKTILIWLIRHRSLARV